MARSRSARLLLRSLWAIWGLIFVGLGIIGMIVPGMPTTGFMLLAAWCFSHSSPRLEAWLLRLPGVGQIVADHRAGLGMPRRAKVIATSMIVVACGFSAWRVERWWVAALMVTAGAVGVCWILWRVPTKERVLAERAARGAT